MIYVWPAPRTRTATRVYNAVLSAIAKILLKKQVKNVRKQKNVKEIICALIKDAKVGG